MPLIQSVLDKVSPNVVADIAITALLIYWLFSLDQGDPRGPACHRRVPCSSLSTAPP